MDGVEYTERNILWLEYEYWANEALIVNPKRIYCSTLSDSLNPAVQDNFSQQVIALIFLGYFASVEESAKI